MMKIKSSTSKSVDRILSFEEKIDHEINLEEQKLQKKQDKVIKDLKSEFETFKEDYKIQMNTEIEEEKQAINQKTQEIVMQAKDKAHSFSYSSEDKKSVLQAVRSEVLE